MKKLLPTLVIASTLAFTSARPQNKVRVECACLVNMSYFKIVQCIGAPDNDATIPDSTH